VESLEKEATFLHDWAARNWCTLQLDAVIGRGHPCVAMCSATLPGSRFVEYNAGARAPEPVRDLHHRLNLLAVLGRGPAAVHQLYLWVRRLDERGYRVVVESSSHLSHPDRAVLRRPTTGGGNT